METDLIDRNNVINVLKILSDKMTPSGKTVMDQAIAVLKDMKSVEEQEFEWCHDCKEYDQEKHCCHRWTKVIRQTIVEVKKQYALEHPEIVHCNECFYSESADDKEDGYRCRHAMNAYRSAIWFGGDYCSYGERNDE